MPAPRRLVLATRNPGKVAELRALMADLSVELVPAAKVEGAPEVEEDRPTLRGNAEKKAAALHAHTGLPALADDTGLEVAALDGRPGVHTARFAGPDADGAANRAHLLDVLDGRADRTARFRTVLAYVTEGGARFFEGTCPGTIIREERGAAGFGYDAVFVPEGHTQTFAEMPAAAKNAVSHRRRALDAFRAYLERTLADAPGDT
jgi:XTP/dITP diphosphohydrolase